jgi:hypothetical protein
MANANESPMGDYPYQNNIRAPSQIGMNDNGTMPQLGRNINGLTEYVKLLVTGNSRASATGKPLGNKYFLKSGAKCQATDTCTTDAGGNSVCQETDRYIYVNNIPSGNIPLISSGMGINFKEFRGLIPGAIENLNVLNPAAIFRAFKDSGSPPCQKITMEVIDNNNNRTEQSNYVTLGDIKSMTPCWFNTSTYNKKNPVTNKQCREAFQNPVAKNSEIVMSDDPIDQLYFAGLAGVGIYIFYRIMEKSP